MWESGGSATSGELASSGAKRQCGAVQCQLSARALNAAHIGIYRHLPIPSSPHIRHSLPDSSMTMKLSHLIIGSFVTPSSRYVSSHRNGRSAYYTPLAQTRRQATNLLIPLLRVNVQLGP